MAPWPLRVLRVRPAPCRSTAGHDAALEVLPAGQVFLRPAGELAVGQVGVERAAGLRSQRHPAVAVDGAAVDCGGQGAATLRGGAGQRRGFAVAAGPPRSRAAPARCRSTAVP